jgi:hypothetical protein
MLLQSTACDYVKYTCKGEFSSVLYFVWYRLAHNQVQTMLSFYRDCIHRPRNGLNDWIDLDEIYDHEIQRIYFITLEFEVQNTILKYPILPDLAKVGVICIFDLVTSVLCIYDLIPTTLGGRARKVILHTKTLATKAVDSAGDLAVSDHVMTVIDNTGDSYAPRQNLIQGESTELTKQQLQTQKRTGWDITTDDNCKVNVAVQQTSVELR